MIIITRFISYFILVSFFISCINTRTIKGPFTLHQENIPTKLENIEYKKHLYSINAELLESYFILINQSTSTKNLEKADDILKTDAYLSSLNSRALSKLFLDLKLNEYNLLMSSFILSENNKALILLVDSNSLNQNWDSISKVKVKKHFSVQNLETTVYTLIKVQR